MRCTGSPGEYFSKNSLSCLARAATPPVGVNEFSGWYLSFYDDDSGETIFIRIASHNESDGTVPVAFVLDRTTYPAYFFATEGSTMTVAFLLVKIDKSFVAGLDGDGAHSTIVEATIGLGHRLGLTVVAEGVETDAQARRLADLGCDRAQGFLYARPRPQPDVSAWLEDYAVGS